MGYVINRAPSGVGRFHRLELRDVFESSTSHSKHMLLLGSHVSAVDSKSSSIFTGYVNRCNDNNIVQIPETVPGNNNAINIMCCYSALKQSSDPDRV